ncbi:Beta-fructofuranosidase, insoluble isoenzyme CWINV4 [Hibiscus syriacus]|uniref:Beta-fructofuranosidase, insoluble isoenzyme CWINV4 n=2 Tax=Hibiscus syriacus TaxID=106335 RepID=A0A6A2ZKF1_HIBSY|nr:Beta-fructofuranosidase, insoluble isoenzyme CWINV4 [Hibiscus syriacus]
MYYNGIYHFFYQYNPKGAVWGNIVWGHAVSKDLINWEPIEPAIYPSKHYDINGAWSGSATILPNNKPIILYTGLDSNSIETQNYAVPANLSDPYLRRWIKPGNNPLIDPENEGGVNASSFRDPSTAWRLNGRWRVLVGSNRNRRGIAYLYESRDFIHWTKAKDPLHSAPNTGMWECPDFYPVSLSGKEGLDPSDHGKHVKHVLKVSLDVTRYDYYTVGTYLTDEDKYVPDNTSVDGCAGLRYDYGNFYASKTFFDPAKRRRILWGWVNESDSTEDDVKKGWAGIQAIPRRVWLDPNKRQLRQWPIRELNSLRGKNVQLSHQELKTGHHIEIKGITAAQADIDVSFYIPTLDKAEPFNPNWKNAEDLCANKGSKVEGGVGPFGLFTLASKNLEEYTAVFFRVFKSSKNHVVLLCSDARSSSLRDGLYKPAFAGFVDVDLADKKLSLRSLIDHSVVESFGGGGKTCITSRVYPTLAVLDNAHLYAFNNGDQTITIKNLNAWSMNKPQMN